MAEAAQAGMTMHYLNSLPDNDVPKYWEEGEEGRKCCLSIDDEKRDVVDFEAICKVVDSCTAFVGMSDYNDFVATINELRGKLIDVTFNSSWLGEEEVADHGDIVRHIGRESRLRPTEQQSRNALSWCSNLQAMHDL